MLKTPGLKRLIVFCAVGTAIAFSALTANAQNSPPTLNSSAPYTGTRGDDLSPASRDDNSALRMRDDHRSAVRLTPQVREMARLDPVRATPIQALTGFASENRIVDKAWFESAPYIVASVTGNLLMGAGHEVYVKGEVNSRVNNLGVFRLGSAYGDEESGEKLAWEAIKLGTVEILTWGAGNDLATALIVSSHEELKAGDRLLPDDTEAFDQVFLPRPSGARFSGEVIDMMNTGNKAAQFESLVIDLGVQHGLRAGDLLAIYEEGALTADPFTKERLQMPATAIGLMLTYRTFDKISYGVILSLTQPATVGSMVANPQ